MYLGMTMYSGLYLLDGLDTNRLMNEKMFLEIPARPL